MNSFHNQIKRAISNPVLQAALDANAERRVQARKTAFKSLPKPLDTLRQRAHNLRAKTINNLDSYLKQFTSKVQENGIILHLAKDANEAVSTILEITKKHDARLVAKSKTMVSEEIKLNTALEATGIQVVETDLGEYIVQLRGEAPAHIITPAVHLRRQEVGQTFHEKLGIPETDHIPTLTNTARTTLRQTFLNADIGISGVNFGVAESGSLCIITNEGNGRMVTTIPPVHIALMGMERLVPTFDDLALMMSLLPRSATGQKITVYTQIIHAPRRANEIDGATERHLIILDNGRSALQGSQLHDALMCIRCGACLNACPIFRELGGHAYVGNQGQHTPYPGPIGSVISPGLFGVAAFGHLAQASTLCGACKDACPVDIDLPGMLLRIRSGIEIQSNNRQPTTPESPGMGLPFPVKFGLNVFAWAAINPSLFRLAQKLAAFFSRILSPRKQWMRLPAITGWGYSKDFPRPALRPFHERFYDQKRTAEKSINWEKGHAASIPQIEKYISKSQLPSAKFEEELTSLGGTFTRCTSDNLGDKILSLLNQRGIKEILAWEEDHLPAGLLDSLEKQSIRIDQALNPKLQVGLTGALAAVAETGTLVQPSGPGRPQSTSLLPDIHIAVLREKDIYENLSQVLKLREIREAATVTLISGPSRTADIEMTLTIGVHGPSEVHVFCLP
jgi:L-lactate dehydrogenase complex protein LldF